MKPPLKRFFMIIVLVFGCVPPVMANQPPGPGVSLPQILMLPLMAFFTVLAGAYPILRSEQKSRIGRAGKWLGLAVLFILGMINEFFSMLVTCLFGSIAVYRGVRLVNWGWKSNSRSETHKWRLTLAGVALCLLALFLMGSAVVFVGYWPDLHQSYQVNALKRLIAFEIAYGRTAKERTGETRFYKVRPGDGNEYAQAVLRRGNVSVNFDSDDKHFTVFVLPYSKFPPWPYRHWTKQGSYRADETGQIRMIWVQRSDEVCPADAPVVMKVDEEDIGQMMKHVYLE